MKIYTLILILTNEDGSDGIMPHSYSSEEIAKDNAELAEAVYPDDELHGWYITVHTLDNPIVNSNTLH